MKIDNVEEQARDFVRIYHLAMTSMIDYFFIAHDKNFKEQQKILNTKIEKSQFSFKERFRPRTIKRNIDQYTDMLSSSEKISALLDNYLANLIILQKRDHPFLKWLDDQGHYKSAFDIFGKKIISWPYQIEIKSEKQLKIELISLRTHFDFFIAKSFLSYSIIEQKGSEYYLTPNSNEVEKITSLASKLLNTINDSELPIQEKISPRLIMDLEKLQNGRGCAKYNDLDKPLNNYIALSRKHEKSNRELLIRFMCMRYARTFGRRKLIKRNNDDLNLIMRLAAPLNYGDGVQHPNLVHKSKKDNYWSTIENKKPVEIIHPDVLIEIISLITGDYEITERKIYEIARKQKKYCDQNNIEDWAIPTL